MKKKILVLSLSLLLIGLTSFAGDIWDTEESSGGGKDFYFQVGLGIMYNSLFSTLEDVSILYNFRGGGHIDLLFSLGMLEIGAEVGVYSMYIEYYAGFGTLCADFPVNALVRINLADDRSMALELRGGLWFVVFGIDDGYSSTTVTVTAFNGGGRFVFDIFYIGADYVFDKSGGFFTAEAGVKFAF